MVSPFVIFHKLWKLVTGNPVGETVNFITIWLGASNSAINPLIYIPTLKSYREELCCCSCNKNKTQDIKSNNIANDHKRRVRRHVEKDNKKTLHKNTENVFSNDCQNNVANNSEHDGMPEMVSHNCVTDCDTTSEKDFDLQSVITQQSIL